MQTKTKMKFSITETLETTKELKALHLRVRIWNTNSAHIISCKFTEFQVFPTTLKYAMW